MGFAVPGQLDRSLPSAMKTRNKIPRTPNNANAGGLDPDWKENFVPDKPFSLEEYI